MEDGRWRIEDWGIWLVCQSRAIASGDDPHPAQRCALAVPLPSMGEGLEPFRVFRVVEPAPSEAEGWSPSRLSVMPRFHASLYSGS
jgi:hypothetical protein